MKTFIITITLPDDCDAQGVKETVEGQLGDLLESEGGELVSVRES